MEKITPLTQALKKARLAKQLSQRDLSARIKMPQAHISRIEKGLVDIKLSTLIELARILELELMLVPRQNITLVKALIRNSDVDGVLSRPKYTLEDLNEDET